MSTLLESTAAALAISHLASARSALPDAPIVADPPPRASALDRARHALTVALARLARGTRPSLPGPASAQG